MPKKTIKLKTRDILEVNAIDDLTPVKRNFAVNVGLKGMSQGKAYANAQGRDKATKSDYETASRLVKDAKVKEHIDDLQAVYKGLAEWALISQVHLAQDSKTPASVKNAIYESLQNKAGHGLTHKIETTKKLKYPEYDMSPEQLHEMIEQAKRNPEKSALDAMLEPSAQS